MWGHQQCGACIESGYMQSPAVAQDLQSCGPQAVQEYVWALVPVIPDFSFRGSFCVGNNKTLRIGSHPTFLPLHLILHQRRPVNCKRIMSTIGIFDTEVFAGIVEGTGEETLDAHFMIDADSGLTIQKCDRAVQIRKNDPFCIPLPDELRLQSEITLYFTEPMTGRTVWESKRQLGVFFYHDLGVIKYSQQLQLAPSVPALGEPIAKQESMYPAAAVIAIILLLVTIVLIPQAIQHFWFRARSKPPVRRTPTPKPLPATVPAGLTHASSISSLSSLANDTSSESASVTTERSHYRRSTGSTYYYPSQLRHRHRPSLAVQNPYESAAEPGEGSGPVLKSAGLTSINSKIFCEDDVYG